MCEVEFTPEMRTFLKENYTRLSHGEMSERLGVCAATLQRFLRSGHAGVEVRRPGRSLAASETDASIDRAGGIDAVAALVARDGVPATAQALGIDYCVLRHRLRKAGYGRKRLDHSDRNASIVTLDREGRSYREIAETVGVTRNVVAGVLDRARRRTLLAGDDIRPPTTGNPLRIIEMASCEW